GYHEHHADQSDAFVAKIPTENPPGIRDCDPGKEIKPDQQSKLGVINSEPGDHERGKRSDRLKLEGHRGSREEQNSQDQPSLADIRANAVAEAHGDTIDLVQTWHRIVTVQPYRRKSQFTASQRVWEPPDRAKGRGWAFASHCPTRGSTSHAGCRNM